LSRRLYFNNTFHKEDVISVIPVNMAVIMNFFFYGRFSTSIMSTGTWVDLEGKKRIYGINGSCEYIKVPSTFNKSRRPVFVLDNKRYTDFSEKNPDGKGYVYQTDAGTDKFLKELQHTITEIRSLIEKNDGCKDINIIIHCHTFDIAKRIAERGFIDHKYLIHLGDKYGNSIQNCNYGIVELFKKTEILDKFSSRPDSGLVIVSPSINEGVDFKHGIARAQIVIKNPIPYLGDMYVKTIKDGNDELGIKSDRGFIEREVFTTTVQQYGRIMRAEDDWGYTFIIDQSMSYRIKAMLTPQSKWRLKNMNIDYFLEGINYTSRIGGPIIFHWPLNKMY
jgi:Rad3-related DNA helicase